NVRGFRTAPGRIRRGPASALRLFFLKYHDHHQALHSFPTRRSSDLAGDHLLAGVGDNLHHVLAVREAAGVEIDVICPPRERPTRDRKSTRLNSSHVAISYAVFCLKKKIAAVPKRPAELLTKMRKAWH